MMKNNHYTTHTHIHTHTHTHTHSHTRQYTLSASNLNRLRSSRRSSRSTGCYQSNCTYTRTHAVHTQSHTQHANTRTHTHTQYIDAQSVAHTHTHTHSHHLTQQTPRQCSVDRPECGVRCHTEVVADNADCLEHPECRAPEETRVLGTAR
jgi:hypothetical protein